MDGTPRPRPRAELPAPACGRCPGTQVGGRTGPSLCRRCTRTEVGNGRLGGRAGPSLRRNLHLLGAPGVRDRVVIIAVQTVLKQVLEAGIRPHFVTALDYHEISRRFYEGLTEADVAGVTLVVEPKANPAWSASATSTSTS